MVKKPLIASGINVDTPALPATKVYELDFKKKKIYQFTFSQ